MEERSYVGHVHGGYRDLGGGGVSSWPTNKPEQKVGMGPLAAGGYHRSAL